MPMRSEGTRRGRLHRRRSEMDWFEEDPWADPNCQPSEDSLNDWEPLLLDSEDEPRVDGSWTDDEEIDDDPDDWGPIRLRHRRRRNSG